MFLDFFWKPEYWPELMWKSSSGVSLYDLLPEIVRSIDESSEMPVVKKILELFQEELEVIKSQASLFTTLQNVSSIPLSFLPHLSRIVGENGMFDWDDEKKRLFVSSLVFLYRVGGQEEAVRDVLNLYGFGDVSFLERWKTVYNEVFNYGDEFLGCESGCESTDESTGGSYPIKSSRIQFYDGGTSVRLSEILSEEQILFLRRILPIHVREVSQGESWEGSCDLGDVEDSSLFVCSSSFSDQLSTDDKITVQNHTVCSLECQVDCEAGPCESAGCQLYCEDSCQEVCMFRCQTHCQDSCESPCMAALQ